MHEKEFILELIPMGDHPAGLSFTTAKLLRARKTLGVEYYLRVREYVKRKIFLERILGKKNFTTIVSYLSLKYIVTLSFNSHSLILNLIILQVLLLSLYSNYFVT